MTPVDLYHRLDGDPSGEPLILAGSLGTTHAMWEPQLAALGARHRLIAIDTRGHGRSPAPSGPYTIAELGCDALALMDRLGLQRVAYVGLSIGGMVGQWLAINAPERITTLVLICTSPHTANADAFRERAATVRAAGSAEPIADGVIERWFTGGFRSARPDATAHYRAMLTASDPEGYASCCEAVAGHDVRDGLADVSAPTLVIAGAQDTAIAPEQGRAIADAIPGARFELLEPAAHIASVEQDQRVNELIIEHLGGRA